MSVPLNATDGATVARVTALLPTLSPDDARYVLMVLDAINTRDRLDANLGRAIANLRKLVTLVDR